MIVALGLVGVLAAMAVPGVGQALARNRVWTASEAVASQIRQARLAAISRNTTFRVVFDCPDEASLRYLAVTGDASIDDAEDRCSQELPNDGSAVHLPVGVDIGTVPTLQVTGRGVFSAIGDAVPLTISISHDSFTRTLVVTSTGRITISGS